MNKFLAGAKRFLRDEEGTEVVEWALVAGLVVAVGAVVFIALGDQVLVALNKVLEAIGGTAVVKAV